MAPSNSFLDLAMIEGLGPWGILPTDPLVIQPQFMENHHHFFMVNHKSSINEPIFDSMMSNQRVFLQLVHEMPGVLKFAKMFIAGSTSDPKKHGFVASTSQLILLHPHPIHGHPQLFWRLHSDLLLSSQPSDVTEEQHLLRDFVHVPLPGLILLEVVHSYKLK